MASNFKALFTSIELGFMLEKAAKTQNKEIDTKKLVKKVFQHFNKKKETINYPELKSKIQEIVKKS